MAKPDEIRLRHMLDAAREAVTFLGGKSREDLISNRLILLAVVKDIEIIGEAASNVSNEWQAALPRVPWRDIIGMRNRLIHAYFDFDVNIVWDVVSTDLPPLIEQLAKFLASQKG